MLLMMMAGWINRHQQDVIEYLMPWTTFYIVLNRAVGQHKALTTQIYPTFFLFVVQM